jgi:hypothetical protein
MRPAQENTQDHCGCYGKDSQFREGDFTEVPARYRMATNQSRPGDVITVVTPAGGMQERKARS